MPHVSYKVLTVAVKAVLYGGAWHLVLAHRIGQAGIALQDRDWIAGV